MLAWLERHQLLVLGAAAVALAAGLALGALKSNDSPPPLQLRFGSDLPAGSPIRVDVAGAVAQPGVYDLEEGDRVEQALAAAGGPTADADLEGLNLARRVHDEELLTVPCRPGAAKAPAVLPSATKVDINTASETLLDMLPGIGEAYSRRIVDSRAVDGPYARPDDLVVRKVIPSATFEKIRDLITVGTSVGP